MVSGLIILFLTALALIWSFLVVILLYEMQRPPRHTAGWALATARPMTPDQVGCDFSSPAIVDAQGQSVPIWMIEGRPPAAREPLTVVFIHGWGQSRLDMLPLVHTYLNQADRLVLFDLPGHGEACGTSALGAKEVDGLLDLLAQLDNHSYLLVGYSMGSAIAFAAASRPEPIAKRVRGVIAYGAYIKFHQSLVGRLRLAGYPSRPISDVALWVMSLLQKKPLSLSDQQISLQCPVMLITGERDQIASPETAKRIADQLPSGSLWIVPDGLHCDAWECQPEQHQVQIENFLKQFDRPS